MITNLAVIAILSFTRANGLNGYGDLMFGSAREMALSGTFYHNPAFVRQNGLTFWLNIGGGTASERWSRPAYDRFGSTVGELTEYSHQWSSIATPDFAAGYADKQKFFYIFRQTDYDLSYRYERVFRSDYYTEEGFHTITQDGALSRLGLAFGMRLQRRKISLDVGLDISQYTVEKDYSEFRGSADGSIDSTIWSFKLSRMAPAAGLVLKAGYRAALGFIYRPALTFVGDSDSVSYPALVSFTVRLTPPSKILTNTYFSYIYDGDIRYSVGFEHEIIKGNWIRFSGMISEDLASLRWAPSFGFGFGHSSKLLSVDVGVRFEPINYRKSAYGNYYTVKEWLTQFGSTLKISF